MLAAIGEVVHAELLIAEHLDAHPEDIDALGMFAALKHRRGELTLAVGCWQSLDHKKGGPRLDSRADLVRLRRAAHALPLAPHDAGGRGPDDDPMLDPRLVAAFRAFDRGDLANARRRCVDVSMTERDKRPRVHRLAVLVEATLCDLAGDLRGSRDALERLGKTREFAHDPERLRLLADTYERTSDSESAQAALRLFDHLEALGHDDGTLDARRARVYRVLANDSAATFHGERHLARIRRAAQRPSAAEIVAVGARTHLPLERLASLFAEDAFGARVVRDARWTGRAEVLVRALAGDLGSASGHDFAPNTPEDFYLASDIARAGGDEVHGHELLARGIHEDLRRSTRPSRYACALLADSLDTPLGETARVLRQHPDAFHAVEAALELDAELHRDEPLRAHRLARWRAEPHLEVAARIPQDATATHRPPGRILSAAVHHLPSGARGLYHELWAHREPAETGRGGHLPHENLFGNLGDDMARDICSVFLAVREWSRRRFPERTVAIESFRYGLKVTKDDEPSSGRSAGLAVGLAFLSLFLERPIAETLAVTGALVTDSHRSLVVGRVGDIEAKVLAAYEARVGVLLVPLANRGDLERSALVPPAVVADVVRYVATFEEAIGHALGAEALR